MGAAVIVCISMQDAVPKLLEPVNMTAGIYHETAGICHAWCNELVTTICLWGQRLNSGIHARYKVLR